MAKICSTSGEVNRMKNEINHVGLTVSDLDSSVKFYCEIAGFTLLSRQDRALGGDWFDTLTENSGALVVSAYVRCGDLTIQLVDYQSGGREPANVDHPAAGSPHLCITVPDIEAHYRLAADHGLRATPIVDHVLAPARSFYVRDPDGVPVEFFQFLESNPAARTASSASRSIG
jgi:glyoxylase I family protein